MAMAPIILLRPPPSLKFYGYGFLAYNFMGAPIILLGGLKFLGYGRILL